MFSSDDGAGGARHEAGARERGEAAVTPYGFASLQQLLLEHAGILLEPE